MIIETITTQIGRWALAHNRIWHLCEAEVAFTSFHDGQLIVVKEGQHEHQQLVAAGIVDSNISALPHVGVREAARQVANVLGCSPQLKRNITYQPSYDGMSLDCLLYRSGHHWRLEVGRIFRDQLKPYIAQEDWACMFSGKLLTRQSILDILEAGIDARKTHELIR